MRLLGTAFVIYKHSLPIAAIMPTVNGKNYSYLVMILMGAHETWGAK